MIKAIFLDRDGTINEEPSDEMVDSIGKVKILPNTLAALKLIKNTNFKIFIVTNQIAIGLGRLTLKEFHQINKYIVSQLRKDGINIKKTYFCPHRPEDNCNCRKPKTGMIEEANKNHKISLPESYVIGDRETDVMMGKSVGCKTILVKTGIDTYTKNVAPDYVAKDLLDAIKFILRSK